ncbi:Rhamnogalacturonan I rhamnosyltransferase 1 [Sesamum alatum]|uniref:O-fucosyltransferase family protein n=1 Tax=Sesamum alatum TaxID=300844 RepID=A0AAE1Y529_9LAMI|nr:Rhamnogalacturonan I rhamnosyltransferase 1 [Sesamum alatum]
MPRQFSGAKVQNMRFEALGTSCCIIQQKGPYLSLHLRYEMDMLAFSGCTHGCTEQEAEELKRLSWQFRFCDLVPLFPLATHAFPSFTSLYFGLGMHFLVEGERDHIKKERRFSWLCPLTPEETALILQALGFDKETQIYIASGEIYGGERRLARIKSAFKDCILGTKRPFQLDRRRLVELLDLHHNGTLSWDEFSVAVRLAHERRMGQPVSRKVIPDKPKEEDYFYANPQECLWEDTSCGDLSAPNITTQWRSERNDATNKPRFHSSVTAMFSTSSQGNSNGSAVAAEVSEDVIFMSSD